MQILNFKKTPFGDSFFGSLVFIEVHKKKFLEEMRNLKEKKAMTKKSIAVGE